MENFWDERYASTDEYVYGTAPNEYFRKNLSELVPGKILMPGEGEGRNAVFAAGMGWKVVAFDSSPEARKKAEKLARDKQTDIDYRICSYENILFSNEEFDCLALIFTHMPGERRTEYHKKLISFLKPGGVLILEYFSKKQIGNNTGGPKDIGMLLSREELLNDFSGFSILETEEKDLLLDEGKFHSGRASVIRARGIK